jgi:hypothetical protein
MSMSWSYHLTCLHEQPPFHLLTTEPIPVNYYLRRGVISLYHDSPTAGHLGISNMTWAIACDYWWHNMKQTIMDYIKGCHLCQSLKNNPMKPKLPLFPIPSDNFTLPFTSVAMDFIVKLPISEGYDSILTITDTFSKACIFIPCNKTINAAKTALLYATYVLPHYGLPSCIISDQDPHFLATIIQELCCILSIQHNTSTAYHPQTDGQSERSNQKMEPGFSQTSIRITGATCYPLPNLPSMPGQMPLPRRPP